MACVDKVNFLWKHKYCEEKQRSVTSKEVGIKNIMTERHTSRFMSDDENVINIVNNPLFLQNV
jgi:hypothetical protein